MTRVGAGPHVDIQAGGPFRSVCTRLANGSSLVNRAFRRSATGQPSDGTPAHFRIACADSHHAMRVSASPLMRERSQA